jgi:nucleoside-diphosphate-sugar epimerase
LKHALIIGCGYLGKRVGSQLLEWGARVTATTTRPERLAELAGLGFEPAVLDLEAPDDTLIWESDPDAVVYSVAPRRTGDPSIGFRDGALDSATRLIEAGLAPGAFVFVSSTGVYHQKDGLLVDEASPARPEEERYLILREAEDELLALGAVVVRLGGLYGPGRSPVEWLARPEMRERILQGGREAWMNWIHVDDAASAVVLALERARSGEIYLGVDDKPVRRGEFYRFAAECAGLEPPELPSTPDDLGKRCSNRKAREQLGFRPELPSYREGLRAIAREGEGRTGDKA